MWQDVVGVLLIEQAIATHLEWPGQVKLSRLRLTLQILYRCQQR